MFHIAEINQAPPPYSMLQYIARVATPKFVPRNCLRYLQTTLIMRGERLVSRNALWRCFLMSNFANSIAAAPHIKLNLVIIFQKLFHVISSCKNLFISKFLMKTAAVKTSQENSVLSSSNPYFYIYYIYCLII